MTDRLRRLLDRYPDLAPCAADIQAGLALLLACYQAGGQVLVCGNGGSAADAEHIVGELMKGVAGVRPLPASVRAKLAAVDPQLAAGLQGALSAISLTAHSGLTSAIANDMDPAFAFAQQVVGYGRPGDVLLALSTSGDSPNVLHALRAARALGLHTLGLTGAGGGALAPLCDVAVRVPATRTGDIQERHLPIYHAWCEALEAALFLPG